MFHSKKPLALALALIHSGSALSLTSIDPSFNDSTRAPTTAPPNAADSQKSIQLPEIGDPSGTVITPLQEQELGAAFFRNLHNEVEVSEDPEVIDYIQSIGQKLAANSDNPEQRFHFFVVTDPTINAFAGPGGYIGVNSGLLLTAEAESELASVLAHEIAHVTQRHLYQAFQAASKMALPTAAAMLAAILLGAKTGSGQLGQAAVVAATAASTQAQINFTRDNEAEADRVGMQLLSRSEFDPRSMPTFFERLQQSTRFSGNRLPEFLLTHPVTVSRIADTRGRAEGFPYRQYPDSFVYQLTRAKLRVLSVRTAQEAVDYFRAVVNHGTIQQQDVAAYGLALAELAIGSNEESRRTLQRLSLKYPDQPQFVNALAKAQADAGNYGHALQLYEMALQRFPGNRAVTLNYVRTLLTTGKAEKARKLLQDSAERQAPTAEFYALMAQAYSGLGNEAESHRYLAEHYYARGQTRAAILQLRIAQRSVGDNYYVNAIIDERLRRFEDEERERRRQR